MKEYFIFLCVLFCGKYCAGYAISSCGTDDTLDVNEKQNITLTCTGITDDRMFWDLKPYNQSIKHISSCTWSTSLCMVSNSSVYEASRTQYDTSTLTVTHATSDSIAGLVRCVGNDGTPAAKCTVRVARPQQVLPEIIGIPENNVLTEGETRTLSCKVTGNVTPVGGVAFFCGDKRGNSADTQSMEGGVTVTTSTLTFAPVTASDDGVECQCYVSSSQLSAHGAPFTLHVVAKHEEQKLPVVAIAAGAGAVLLIVAIVVTVIVVVVMKKPTRDPTYARPTRRSQVIDTNIYTGLEPQQQGSDDQEEDVYEDTTGQQPAGHGTVEYVNTATGTQAAEGTVYINV